MKEELRKVIERGMPLLLENLIVDSVFLATFLQENIFVADVIDDIEVGNYI